mgnify:CR=1 FL=1
MEAREEEGSAAAEKVAGLVEVETVEVEKESDSEVAD